MDKPFQTPRQIIDAAVVSSKLKPGCVAMQSHIRGTSNQEPLTFGLAGMVQYAQAYKARHETKLCEDYVLGPLFLQTLTGLRGVLNGDGAIAMQLGVSTDSKDNGVCESIFWQAMNESGFTEKDL